MKKLIFVLPVLAAFACGDDDDSETPSLDGAKPAITAYADAVEIGYAESLAAAVVLDDAIKAFVAAPSEITHTAAKEAWKAARLPYRQTEAWRFYSGPIEDAKGEEADYEGEINAWPLAEASIDYVLVEGEGGEPTRDYKGVVNDLEAFPTVDKATIIAANFQNGEEDVKTGYHAIEFLLWGQDLATDGPGARPYTDYLVGKAATALNGDRRGAYLLAVSALLVEDLTHVHGRWAKDGGDYRVAFLADPAKTSLDKVFTGIGTLAAAELSGERMETAFTDHEQEAEHSCFSDTTKDDIWGNAKSLENTYLGKFGSFDGEGFDVIVAAFDPALDARMKAALADALVKIDAIPAPFDQAIADDASQADKDKVRAAIDAVVLVGTVTKEIGVTLGLDVVTELE